MRIGVAGGGHLGKIHIKCIQWLPEYELVGFFDPNPSVAEEVSKRFGVRAFPSLEDLLAEIDVLDVVSPTSTHFELADKGLEAGCHVFIEKPVTSSLSACQKLLEKENRNNGLKIAVGHNERFNPAFLSVQNSIKNPQFLFANRMAPFNPRGRDVSVVLDLMIHDIDLVLLIAESSVQSVSANGFSLQNASHDFVNAQIVFENGLEANLTASRISLKPVRELTVFQDNSYITLDFLEKQSSFIRIADEVKEGHLHQRVIELPKPGGSTQKIVIETTEKSDINAIKMELKSFYQCINEKSSPLVSLKEATEAIDLAERIMDACGDPSNHTNH